MNTQHQLPNIIIGVCGHAGAGKDTVAEYLDAEFNFWVYHFAGPVKKVAAEAFEVPLASFLMRDTKEAKVDYWNYSPREMAQLVGTELFRNTFGDDFWIRRLSLELQRLNYTAKIVIPDVRFQNELDWILSQQHGYIVHLTRPGYTGNVGISGHTSEQLDFINLYTQPHERIYHIENNYEIKDLQCKVARVTEHILKLNTPIQHQSV